MDVGDWLRSLGLGKYEATFRDNAIDMDVLSDLTESDLIGFGFLFGDRKRLLKAIASLGPAETGSKPSHPPAFSTDAAERRQLTVMFGDLVGSTALSARLDPEDMRLVIRAYQDACSGVVVRYDGFVARFLGDGILAYFGFPRAHEDDAARAVHAGLEISAAVAGLQTRAREKLAVRVGIATGLVVVGDLVGEGSAQEQAVVGDTPNLAARLQGLAEAGGVVVAAATRRLLGDRFQLRNLGKHAVKGLAEPIEAWAALGVSQSDSRFEAAQATRLGGFVGREAEAKNLLEHQRRAWAGHGQVVLISGEAGIGKSRMSAWLAAQIADAPHTRLRYQCSPYHRDSALYPFVQQLERAAGISPQETAEAKLDKLEMALGRATNRIGEVAPLIASMLSIPVGQRYPSLDLSPAEQRRRTLSALLDRIESLARKQPVLMQFEDAHWADATSLEVLDLAVERVRSLPALLVITHRPEFESPWKGLPEVTTIALGRLDRVQAETLVKCVTGGRALPADVLAQIVAKTDGVPLFVEELTKNVMESGLLIEDGERYRLDGPLPPLAIPSTLQDSLMARLDRLAAVKEIAQIGSAIGREFSYSLLHAVVDRDEATLRTALAQLEESNLVFRSGTLPAARYTFKHALVQDTAYESLLKSRRQILHQRIAETLREKFSTVAEAEPELLAHHFAQAGLTEPAIEYLGKAGDLALRRSAFKEAIAHLSKAIEMSEALGEGQKLLGKLKLLVSYGHALMSARGPGVPETKAAFERAFVAASAAEGAPERLSVVYGLWIGCVNRGELGPMREWAGAFLREAAAHPNPGEVGVAHRTNGVTHWYAGEFEEARAHLEQALVIFDPERDGDLAFRFGHDAGVSTMFYLAATLWPLGKVDRARAMIDEMMARAARLDQLATTVSAYGYGALFEYLRADFARAGAHAERLADISNKHDIPMLFKLLAMLLDGWRDCRSGDQPTGLAKIRQSTMVGRGINPAFLCSMAASLVADAEVSSGDINSAQATLANALIETERNGHRWLDAEVHRMRGEILRMRSPADPAPAELSFLAAIAIAKRQKAGSFELRSALSLAKLYHENSRGPDARAVLGPALEGFSPTPEFPEIEEAQALLAAV